MRESLHSALIVFLLLAGLTACRSHKPEEEVRKAFESCRTAVEAGDAAATTEPLDPAFRGPEDLNKASARLYLMGVFRQEKVGVTVVRNEVAVRGNEALQEVDPISSPGAAVGSCPRKPPSAASICAGGSRGAFSAFWNCSPWTASRPSEGLA